MAIKRVVCFGVGSNSMGELNTVSFGILTESGWILVDCGPDTPRQLTKAGIVYSEVAGIILTHSHMDHCLGVPYFLFGRNLSLMSRAKAKEAVPPIQVVSDGWLWDCLSELLTKLHPDVRELVYRCEHSAVPIHGSVELGGRNVLLHAVQTLHSVPTYGIRVSDDQGTSVSYSSDTKPCEAFERLAKDSTCVIVEGMVPQEALNFANATKHSTAFEAGEAAQRIGCACTFMVHLRPEYAHRKADLEREASEAAGFPIRYPREGETILEL